jgi:hypothetical protein
MNQNSFLPLPQSPSSLGARWALAGVNRAVAQPVPEAPGLSDVSLAGPEGMAPCRASVSVFVAGHFFPLLFDYLQRSSEPGIRCPENLSPLKNGEVAR